jgi:hypothetical protein
VPFCPPKPLPTLGAPLIPVIPEFPSRSKEIVKFTNQLPSYQLRPGWCKFVASMSIRFDLGQSSPYSWMTAGLGAKR